MLLEETLIVRIMTQSRRGCQQALPPNFGVDFFIGADRRMWALLNWFLTNWCLDTIMSDYYPLLATSGPQSHAS